jgi:threonine/homoserine/homoserine lactone efflux protein
MLSAGRLAAFGAVAFMIVLIPGPSVLFMVGRALAHGRRAALVSMLGNEAGEWVLAVLVAFGLGSVLQRSAVLFTAVKLAGAGYLVYLGVRAVLSSGHGPAAAGTAAAPRAARSAADGFVVGVANPKTAVFFAAVLPQFVNRQGGHVPVQMLILGSLFVLVALIGDTLWTLAASAARAWFARSARRQRLVGGAGGVTMIGLGIALAVSGQRS